MSVTVTLSFKTSRGQAKLSADLTGMNFTEMTTEVENFFTAALAMDSGIRKQKEEFQKFSIPAINPVQMEHQQEEIMVIS